MLNDNGRLWYPGHPVHAAEVRGSRVVESNVGDGDAVFAEGEEGEC